jgi:DNA invertase Pin-like site-specific DNA recombinase
MTRTIAYQPVAPHDPDPRPELDALARHGYDILFTEIVSASDRPQLSAALAALRPGDTFLFSRAACIAASTTELLDLVTLLHERDIKVTSLTETFAPHTDLGRITLQALALSAQYAAELQAERRAATSHNLPATAPVPGRRPPGRPRAVGSTELAELRRLINDHDMSVTNAARAIGIGRSTAYQALRDDAI